MNNLKYKVTAIVFLALILFTGGMTLIQNRGNISIEKELINTTFNENLFGFDYYIETWSIAQNAIGTNLFDDSAYGVIIRDTHKKLHFPADVQSCEKETAALLELAKNLEAREIPFMYVQAPNKKLEGYTILPVGGYNHANENIDVLLQNLKLNGVHTYDLRAQIIADKLPREDIFYKTDHHWTTPTAFWAFSHLVGELNSKFDLNLDSDGYYRDIENYNIETFEKYFLGSLGRRVGQSVAGLDDYTFISPKFDTEYALYNAQISTETPFAAGSFNDTITDKNFLYGEDMSLNRHASYFTWDYGRLIVRNKLAESSPRILLIKDSFSLPVAAFLSTTVSELHVVDLRDEGAPKSISKYVDKYDFDAVIVMYNPEVLATPLFNFEK